MDRSKKIKLVVRFVFHSKFKFVVQFIMSDNVAVDKVALGQVSLRVLRFFPVNIILLSCSYISEEWAIGPMVVAVTDSLTAQAWTTKTLHSKSHYSWRSVNQSVLVSSPFWGSWPDSTYVTGLTVTVLVSWGAPSDEGAGLSFVWSLFLSFVQLYICRPTINYSISIHFQLYTVKIKAVALHVMEALGGREGIAPTHSRPRH
jgi:hypothetical protein